MDPKIFFFGFYWLDWIFFFYEVLPFSLFRTSEALNNKNCFNSTSGSQFMKFFL